MKIEKRNILYYCDEGYEPVSDHIWAYPINDMGHTLNSGWILLETEEEKELFFEILNNCGVANSNNLDRLIVDLFDSDYRDPIKLLKAIDKIAKNKKVPEGTITNDRGFFHVKNDDFCHHTEAQAAYWYNIEHTRKKDIEIIYKNI